MLFWVETRKCSLITPRRGWRGTFRAAFALDLERRLSRSLAEWPIVGTLIARPELKQHWEPSEAAFRRLLSWLDEGIASHGERFRRHMTRRG